MKNNRIFCSLFLSVLFLVVACKDGTPALEFPEEFQNTLWEYTEGDSSEIFIMIFSDKEIEFISKYDFDDCYFRYKAELIEINSDGKFFIEEVEDGEIQGSSAYIKREGDNLWVSGVRTYQTKEIYIQSTRSSSTFSPRCEY